MSDSVFIMESSDFDKRFDDLEKGIQIIKNTTKKEIQNLKSQIEIKPILKFETLFLEKVNVSTWEDSSWYSSKKIRIDFSKECNEILKTKGLGSYDTWNGYFKYPITEEGVKSALEFIDKVAELDQDKHKSNIDKCKSNNDTYNSLMALLKRIGISDTYYGYKTNRSSKKETLYYNWNSEISNQIPKCYSSSRITDLVKKYKDSIQKIFDTEQKKIADENRKKEEEKKLKQQTKKLALLLSKYDMDLERDWNDLLEVIIHKNKYLYLAYYLEKNRGDWNDGCSYAETGLDSFKIENNLDQSIYDDINEYISNWGDYMDGRCFRDCNYSYDVIYGMVAESEPDLYKDFNVIKENIDD